ncbi:MAG: hypothetical protein KDN22_09310 [Verrucomicrobiae bacterium]|nr:hypothetical protein [Verrucomicrobiae bacterium]
MKPHLPTFIVGTLLFWSVNTASAQTRTFTDTTGRKTEASIESVSGESVNLLATNGNRYTVAIDRFAEEDRAFILKWDKENPGSAAISFLRYEINSDRRKIPNPRGKLDPAYSKIANSNTFFEITVENPTREPVPEMKMEYVIYKRIYERQNGKRTKWEIVETKKEQSIGEIAGGKKFDTKTETILARTEIKRADPKKDLPEINLSETVLGVVVDFYVKDRKIKTVPYPPNMLIKMQEEKERDERKKLEEQGRRGSDLSIPKDEKADETRRNDNDPTSGGR